MTRAQRITFVVYCLLVVYCCVWVPWHVDLRTRNDVRLGYTWIWSGPDRGALDTAAITLRLVAATALGAAAFLLARKWKAILSASIIAGLGFAGILLYGYGTNKIAERRIQKIHNCAVAKVATAKCTPPNNQGDIFDQVARELAQRGKTTGTGSKATVIPSPPPGFVLDQKDRIDLSAGLEDERQVGFLEVCDRYGLSNNPTAQEEDKAIAAAEKECTGETDPKQKSAHEQIEEYKRQHGIK
jgi:hypothetical protein